MYIDNDKDFFQDTGMSSKKIKIMTGETPTVLDVVGLSNRSASRVAAAMSKNFGYTVQEVKLSHETIRKNRNIQCKSS